MKWLVLCVLASGAAAAPGPALLRVRRSQYGGYSAPPCAASHAAPAVALPSAFQLGLPQFAPQFQHQQQFTQPFAPQPGFFAAPHYRAEEAFDDGETLAFSDEAPSARYAYGAAPVQALSAAAGATFPALGPAVGVFRNAQAGGCAVPLLLSCSPSVTPGQLVRATPQYNAAAAAAAPAAYRDDAAPPPAPEDQQDKHQHQQHDTHKHQ